MDGNTGQDPIDASGEVAAMPARNSVKAEAAPPGGRDVSGSNKTADRPHHITIALGLLSPVLALISLAISFYVFKDSQRSMRVAQRAYLSFHVESAHVTPDYRVETRVSLKNIGNTPAYIQEIKQELYAIEADDTVHHIGGASETSPNFDALGPKDDPFVLAYGTTFKPQEFVGDRSIVLRSEIRWEDAFGERQPPTAFCALLTDITPPIVERRTLRAVPCIKGITVSIGGVTSTAAPPATQVAETRSGSSPTQSSGAMRRPDHALNATATFDLEDWSEKNTRFAVRVDLVNLGSVPEIVRSAVLVMKESLKSQSGYFLTNGQKGPFTLSPGQVLSFVLQPPITGGVLDEMTPTSKDTVQAELGIEFFLVRPDGSEGKFTYPLGLLKYNDGPENFDFDEWVPSEGKWADLFAKELPAGRLRPSWEKAFDRDDEREFAFRVSRLLSALDALSDQTNQHRLASGKTSSDVEALLRRFAAASEFPVHDPRYDRVSPADLLSRWRREAEPETSPWMARAIQALTVWDQWIAEHRRSLTDPIALGAALHQDFVLRRWRDSGALPFLGCSLSVPFC